MGVTSINIHFTAGEECNDVFRGYAADFAVP
jgi:hypothetical protein